VGPLSVKGTALSAGVFSVGGFLADRFTRLLQLGPAIDPGGDTVPVPTEGAADSVLSEAWLLVFTIFTPFIPFLYLRAGFSTRHTAGHT